jgi:hypothetical protein
MESAFKNLLTVLRNSREPAERTLHDSLLPARATLRGARSQADRWFDRSRCPPDVLFSAFLALYRAYRDCGHRILQVQSWSRYSLAESFALGQSHAADQSFVDNLVDAMEHPELPCIKDTIRQYGVMFSTISNPSPRRGPEP